MVYIYKKSMGGKVYYYLRASIRNKKGKIVVKDIAYLGSTLEELHDKLTKLPKYEKEIKKTYRTLQNFIESNRYKDKANNLKLKQDPYLGYKLIDVEACKIHYSSVFKHYDELTKKEIMKNFIIEFSFNTTFI